MNATPFDLDGAFSRFFATIGRDRGDEHVLHASDLGGCLFATYLRLKGEAQMPFDDDSRDAFLMGFAVEDYVGAALAEFIAQGYVVTKGREIVHEGLVGHLDYDISDPAGNVLAVIDVRTTKAKALEVKHDHAVKSAFYAKALGAPVFAEWLFSLGFGKVTGNRAVWLTTADYADEIATMIPQLHAIRDGAEPAVEPPRNETWRCEKYCSAPCPRNLRYDPEMVSL
jgi:hypothetical protein